MFAWRSTYSVGVPNIDAQHKHLIATISQLHQAMMQGKAKPVLTGILTDLVHHTEVHFADEERLMRQKNYPRALPHVEEHRRLTTMARKLQHDYAAGRVGMTVETLDFLKTWLSDHIMTMDQDYAVFYSAQATQ